MPIKPKKSRQLRAACQCKEQCLHTETLPDRAPPGNAGKSLENPLQDLADQLDDEGSWTITQPPSHTEAHWEDCEFTEAEGGEELDVDVFNHIMESGRNSAVFDKFKIKYQRLPQVSKTTVHRNAKKRKGLRKAARRCTPLTAGFLKDSIPDWVSRSEGLAQGTSPQASIPEGEAIGALEKKLRSEKVPIIRQNRPGIKLFQPI